VRAPHVIYHHNKSSLARPPKPLQVYIVPSEDPHMSEYPPDRFKRREFISKCVDARSLVLCA